MADIIHTYETIKKWKNMELPKHLSDIESLNEFHDKVMVHVFNLAVSRLDKGEPPCEFAWFITGSGGRFEQALSSDQDHGIIYKESNQENDNYFRELGREIAYGLNMAGYPYCHGNVMSSNPTWCKSLNDWKEQLLMWMEEESWEAIRFLQIFYDARVLKGKFEYTEVLKMYMYDYEIAHPALLKRFMKNIMHIKNGIGPIGQLIVEKYGRDHAFIDLKYVSYIPYVNAIRLLAIKEGLYETSTLGRINELVRINGYGAELRNCKSNFLELLKYRLSIYNDDSYNDNHLLDIKNLSKEEKKEIKRIIREGKRLHHYVCGLIEKGC